MRRKNTTVFDPAAESPASEGACGQRIDASPEETPVSPGRLDFLSTEFNRVDDLDDNMENYRSFHSLAGIVTSDMRYHEERKKNRKVTDTIAEKPQEKEQEEGCEKESERATYPSPLTIVSRGRVLLIDTNLERAITCAESMSGKGLSCTLCLANCSDPVPSASLLGSAVLIEASGLVVSGGFGGFVAMATGADGRKIGLATLIGKLSALREHQTSCFDLVLDLQTNPSFAGKQLPVGYYAPGESKSRLEAALLELPEMRGRFKKPQLTEVLHDRCLNGRFRDHDCLRCLTICPSVAIGAEGRKITINQHLCQGCGACTLVCPADAINLLHPPQATLLAELAGLLTDAAADKRLLPDLILYDANIDVDVVGNRRAARADSSIYCQVEDIGRLGLEVLLAALACGAGSVTLLVDLNCPADIREALTRQVEQGVVIAEGLQLPEDSFRLVFLSRSEGHLAAAMEDLLQGVPGRSLHAPLPPVAFSFDHDKRTLIRLAAEHLAQASEREPPVIGLPTGAPFGRLAIDQSCSLCMACAGICPSGALLASGDAPRLSFVESRCHQCGLCAASCPEHAIRLEPRLLCSTELADRQTILREVEPFKCIECQEPFASAAMIDRLQERLDGHWMYRTNRQVRRLQMCRTCRTRDALMAGDYHS